MSDQRKEICRNARNSRRDWLQRVTRKMATTYSGIIEISQYVAVVFFRSHNAIRDKFWRTFCPCPRDLTLWNLGRSRGSQGCVKSCDFKSLLIKIALARW